MEAHGRSNSALRNPCGEADVSPRQEITVTSMADKKEHEELSMVAWQNTALTKGDSLLITAGEREGREEAEQLSNPGEPVMTQAGKRQHNWVLLCSLLSFLPPSTPLLQNAPIKGSP